MEPDPSSRAAARRIVEEVLAEHAARATALDGVAPVTIVERPDTPAWRAARRIVEETLAEHAARAVIPPELRVGVVVDLEEGDVEVAVDVDGSGTTSAQPMDPDTAADRSAPRAMSVVAPIERDETPARSARRVVEAVLDDHGVEPEPARTRSGAPTAFEIDPVPQPLPEPVESSPSEPELSESEPEPTDSEPAASEPSEARVDEAATGAADDQVSEVTDWELIPIDNARLRAAIPERLFAPDPDTADVDDPLEVAAANDEAAAVPAPEASLPVEDPPPPPPPPTAASGPPLLPDPDAPVTIAARIVAEVLADRVRAEREARDPEAEAARAATDGSDIPEEPRDIPDRPDEVPGAPGTLVFETGAGGSANPSGSSQAPVSEPVWDSRAPEVDPDTGPDDALFPDLDVAAVDELDDRPPGALDGGVPVANTPDGADPGSARGMLTVEAGPEDVQVLDPLAYAPSAERLPGEAPEDELWADEASGAITTEDGLVAEDEYGQWPDPIVPPRRTGRWLITTVVGAVALALLLPLAIGALRNLVSFS